MKVHHRPVPTREAAKDFIGKMIDQADVFTGEVWFVTDDDNQAVIAVTGTAAHAAVNAERIASPDGERWRAMRDAMLSADDNFLALLEQHTPDPKTAAEVDAAVDYAIRETKKA